MSFTGVSDQQQPILPDSVEALIAGWVWRALGGVLLLLTLLVWVALVSWTSTDPSLTHATGGATRNLLGPVGAIVSDLCLQVFALTSALALIAPVVWGLQLALGEAIPRIRAQMLMMIGGVLLLSGGFSALPIADSWPLAHGYGGFVGDMIFNVLAAIVGLVASAIATPIAGFAAMTVGAWLFFRSLGISGEALRLAWTIDQTAPQSQTAARGVQPDKSALRPPPLPEPVDVSRWIRALAAGRGNLGERLASARTQLKEQFVDQRGDRWMTSDETASDRVPRDRAHFDALHDAPLARAADRFAADIDDADDHHSHEHADLVAAPTAGRHPRPVGDRDFDAFYGDDDPDGMAGDGFDDLDNDDARLVDDSRGIAARFAPRPQGRTATPRPARGTNTASTAIPRSDVPKRKTKTQASPRGRYVPPSLNLLERGTGDAQGGHELSQTVMRGNARLLEDVLADFGVKGAVRNIHPGPVITLYELEIARGIKASRVIGLADDIARSMSAPSARIDTIPGRNTLGIELPNINRSTVRFRDLLEDAVFKAGDQALPLALGKAIDGAPVVADLARMPHLLVAGTTGSGKSVGVNAMILSLMYRFSPNELRFIMVDPKMLELSVYNGVPHLLTPVVTDPNKAIVALNWAIREMEERYKRMAELGVRNITAYNTRIFHAAQQGQSLNERVQTGFDAETGEAVYAVREIDLTPLPHIVVVVDEFADLMIVAGKEIDAAVQRLAQMARAAGIHLIMATQRPSVDIVTGTIKANFPSRIGFKVASKIDSRTIINAQGAEQLLGQGDMLMSDGSGKLVRVHGAFVSDDEVEAVASHLRAQPGPGYVDDVTVETEPPAAADDTSPSSGEDLYDKAVAIVLRDQKASVSYLQRRLSIGYNRAADLIERMEADGVVGPANNVGKRAILGVGGYGDIG
ncbi:MAG: DNA translocase FtsK [Pseudomonadota bacterium]